MLDGIMYFSFSLYLLNMLALVCFLILKKDKGVLSGIMLSGVVYCFLIGLLSVPFGMMVFFAAIIGARWSMLVDVLALSPLFVGFVYYRNSKRAYACSVSATDRSLAWRVRLLGFLFALAVPVIVEWNF